MWIFHDFSFAIFFLSSVVEASSRGGCGRSAWLVVLFNLLCMGMVSEVGNHYDIDVEGDDSVFFTCAFDII